MNEQCFRWMSFEATGETAVIIFFINKIEQEKESKR